MISLYGRTIKILLVCFLFVNFQGVVFSEDSGEDVPAEHFYSAEDLAGMEDGGLEVDYDLVVRSIDLKDGSIDLDYCREAKEGAKEAIEKIAGRRDTSRGKIDHFRGKMSGVVEDEVFFRALKNELKEICEVGPDKNVYETIEGLVAKIKALEREKKRRNEEEFLVKKTGWLPVLVSLAVSGATFGVCYAFYNDLRKRWGEERV